MADKVEQPVIPELRKLRHQSLKFLVGLGDILMDSLFLPNF
jgi:hypothetical protein